MSYCVAGTGACCFDRVNKVIYVNLSTRADAEVAETLAKLMNYDLVTFRAFDENGDAIYHTNVMMAIGTSLCILCEESITSSVEREYVRKKLQESGHTIIPISLHQMRMYCGNTLEMLFGDGSGRTFLAMSATAFANFSEDEKEEMGKHVDEIVPIDVTTIETVGGGSVRCMIGELFA